jgi:hypothetical protein
MTNRIAGLSGVIIIATLWWQPSRSVACEVNADRLAQSGHVYLANFSSAENALKVVVDGVSYSGHITPHADKADYGNNGNFSGPLGQGKWGRAFLFASSAKVIQCRIDSGLPELIGSCIDADGRNYKLLSSNR